MRLKRFIKIALLTVGALLLFAVPPAAYEFGGYYDALEQEVVTRFSGQRWTIPSQVYSDSTTIYPGQKFGDLGFFQRLARLNYHRVDAGQVSARGEYSYDPKKRRLALFLHDFRYPYGGFPGELIEMKIFGSGHDLIN